jgi:hypothetical protein
LEAQGWHFLYALQEFAKHDAHPEKYSRELTFENPRTKAMHTCSVRHERFLAPEVFFRPDFISDEHTTSLPQACHLSMALSFLHVTHITLPTICMDSHAIPWTRLAD